jgi:hypothetical protein
LELRHDIITPDVYGVPIKNIYPRLMKAIKDKTLINS